MQIVESILAVCSLLLVWWTWYVWWYRAARKIIEHGRMRVDLGIKMPPLSRWIVPTVQIRLTSGPYGTRQVQGRACATRWWTIGTAEAMRGHSMQLLYDETIERVNTWVTNDIASRVPTKVIKQWKQEPR